MLAERPRGAPGVARRGPPPMTLADDLPDERCSTGCPLLDRFLGGGFPVGHVTELVGEAAACKSQLALQAMAAVQLPPELGGLLGSAIWIRTEPASMQRLSSVASVVSRLASVRAAAAGLPPGLVPSASALLRGVFVRDRPLSAPRELLNELSATEQSLLQLEARVWVHGGAGSDAGRPTAAQTPGQQAPGPFPSAPLPQGPLPATSHSSPLHPHVSRASSQPSSPLPRLPRLLVIDSIAAPFRGAEPDDPTAHDAARRAEVLFAIGRRLRELAARFGLAVLVTNQVADDVGNDAAPPAPAGLERAAALFTSLAGTPTPAVLQAAHALPSPPAAAAAFCDRGYVSENATPTTGSFGGRTRAPTPKAPNGLPHPSPLSTRDPAPFPPLPPPDASLPARGSAFPLRTSGRLVRPALGLAWSSAGPSTRLFLSREGGPGGGGERAVGREVRVVFSSFLPERAAAVEMTNDGLRALVE